MLLFLVRQLLAASSPTQVLGAGLAGALEEDFCRPLEDYGPR
jgi:hypothetical protein